MDCTGIKMKWIQIDYEYQPPLIFACTTDIKYSAQWVPRNGRRADHYKLWHLEAPDTRQCDLRF